MKKISGLFIMKIQKDFEVKISIFKGTLFKFSKKIHIMMLKYLFSVLN